jgi:CIC family chloride channel protein
MASGMGAGIGAIFRAPLGGAVLATEILYRNDLEQDVFVPALIASAVSYSVFAFWIGWQPLFALPAIQGITSPIQLGYYIVLGIICGSMGIIMEKTVHRIERFFQHLRLPLWLKPALGGLLVGLIGLAFPEILGIGYGWVQVTLLGTGIFSFSLLVLCLLPFCKILTASFSLGSGGPGGLFGPGLVAGGLLGAVVWRLGFPWLPGWPATPASFILVSMMAMFGSIVRAPLAVMLMVVEMSGSLTLLAPAMIAVSIAYLTVGNYTMYPGQPNTRADSPAHRLRMSFPLLTLLTAEEAMRPVRTSLLVDQTLEEAASIMQAAAYEEVPVLDNQQRVVGALSLTNIAQVPTEQHTSRKIAEIMNRNVPACASNMTLYAVLQYMIVNHVHWLLVFEQAIADQPGRLLGILTLEDIMRQALLEKRSSTQDISPQRLEMVGEMD